MQIQTYTSTAPLREAYEPLGGSSSGQHVLLQDAYSYSPGLAGNFQMQGYTEKWVPPQHRRALGSTTTTTTTTITTSSSYLQRLDTATW
jgi:hypothetical protein